MKIRMTRGHQAQPVQYENVTVYASVEIDTDVDIGYSDLTTEEAEKDLSSTLDNLLRPGVERILKTGGNRINESHLWDFYEYE